MRMVTSFRQESGTSGDQPSLRAWVSHSGGASFKLLEILPNSIAQERVFGIAKRCGLESWHPIGMHRFSCDKDHN